MIVLIQNGIEIEKPMIREYPHSTVISGISLIGSANLNGVIHNSHKDSILLSPFHNPNVPHEVSEAQTRKFGELYQNEDESINKILYEESAVKSRWQKLVYNCVLNTVCTIAGLDVNRCQINGANLDIFVPAMNVRGSKLTVRTCICILEMESSILHPCWWIRGRNNYLN